MNRNQYKEGRIKKALHGTSRREIFPETIEMKEKENKINKEGSDIKLEEKEIGKAMMKRNMKKTTGYDDIHRSMEIRRRECQKKLGGNKKEDIETRK